MAALTLLTFVVYITTTIVIANEQKAIVDSIFANYDKRVRPIIANANKTQLTVSLEYFYLIEIVESRESMSFAANVIMTWNDDYLVWNPSKFNDTTYIIVPRWMVWIPDVIVSNSKSMTPLIERIKRYVSINYNGSVSLVAPAVYETVCDIDVSRFPFDTQTCIVDFAPWVYDNDIDVLPGPMLPNNSIMENSEWSVENVSYNMTYWNETVSLMFTLNRRSTYYIFVCIVPSYIIVAVCLLGVFTPGSTQLHRDEKILLGITTLLSMAVMLNIISDKMPKSIMLPSLGWLIIFQILLCAIGLLLSSILLVVQKKAVLYRWRVPNWFGHKTNVIEPTKLLHRISLIADRLINKYDREGYIDVNKAEMQLEKIAKSIAKIDHYINEKEYVYDLEEKWSEFFMIIDFILHLTFQFIHLAGALLILLL